VVVVCCVLLALVLLLLAAAALVAPFVVGSPQAQAQEPGALPELPQTVQAIPGDARLTLTWSAPSSWGDNAALRYEIDIAGGTFYGSASPPEEGSAHWRALASPATTDTSYTLSGDILQHDAQTYQHTVTNGTKYHLRIRAVSEHPTDQDDSNPGHWVVVTGTPTPAGFTVFPDTLTVPVGSRACYVVYPVTQPTHALNVTADTAALTAEVGGSTVTYATLSDGTPSDWRSPDATGENRETGAGFCITGVTVTTSPLSITHTVTSDDSTYNGVSPSSVILQVLAADTKPTIRFLNRTLRVVEGDTPTEEVLHPSHVPSLRTREVTVRLDITPAPTSDGHVIWMVPHPGRDCVGGPGYDCTKGWPISTSADYNVDWVAEGLLARRVYYTSGSNDMQFTFEVRSDNYPEDDETVTIYLMEQQFEENTSFTPNTAVCVGSCSSPTHSQESTVVTIIDDDGGKPPLIGGL